VSVVAKGSRGFRKIRQDLQQRFRDSNGMLKNYNKLKSYKKSYKFC
jgi:uridine kinase